jgi:hypothetical protein
MRTPLFSVSVDTSGMVDLISLGDIARVVKEQIWRQEATGMTSVVTG